DQLRQHLAGEYKELVKNENPNLNDIEVMADVVPADLVNDVSPDVRRYWIFAQHPFFNQYSFSARSFGRAVKRWEAENRDDLRRARVVYVVARSDSSHSASRAYINVGKSGQ